MNLYIIIPVHNRKDFTHNCLLSLSKQTYSNFKIIIIDDGSTDGTTEMILKEFQQVILLHGDGNFWWTRSVNLGIKHALSKRAEIIITLNDDLIVEDNYLENFTNLHKQYPDALISSSSYNINNKRELVFNGMKINWFTAKYSCFLEKEVPVSYKMKDFNKSDFLPARGLLIPVDVFNKIGLFDEKRFPQTAADFDFVWNAKKAGFQSLCATSCKTFCYPSESCITKTIKEKSISNFYNYLFSIKSAANIIVRFRFILKNCPKHLIVIHIIFDIIRTVFSYIKPIKNTSAKKVSTCV